MSINPEKLRSVAEAGHATIVTPADAPMMAEAMEIADQAAWDAIECNTAAHGDFHSLDEIDPDDREWIDQSARYLQSRGLLVHHPENARWVTLKEGE